MASKRLLLFPALVAAVAINAACGDPPGSPSIISIDPESQRADFAPTVLEVLIEGEGFHERVVPDTQNPSSSKLARPVVLFDGVAVDSTYMGPTLIRAYLRDLQLAAVGVHSLDVRNPDGSVAGPVDFFVTGPATQLVIGTGAEPATNGTSNTVVLNFEIRDAAGLRVGAGEDFSASVILSTATAFVLQSSLSIAQGTETGTVTVRWNRVGIVDVDMALTTTSLQVVPGYASFIAGLASRVRIVPSGQTLVWAVSGVVPNAGVQVTDRDGNPVTLHQGLTVSFADPQAGCPVSPCPSYFAPQPPYTMVVPENSGGGTFVFPDHVECTQQPVGAQQLCLNVRPTSGSVPIGWTTTGSVYIWIAP